MSTDTLLKILSWNILQGGGSRCDEIAATLREYEPDIVTLQEFRNNKNGKRLTTELKESGLGYVFSPAVNNIKENSILVASRYPMRASGFPSGLAPVHCVSAEIEVEATKFVNLMAVHFPQKKAQVPLFEALFNLPDDWLNGHSLLMGDFNCGIPWIDSETRTFYATHYFQQLLQNGWHDTWRERWPDAREFTWISSVRKNGFRYDHTLVSRSVNELVESVFYDHGVRERKISDHSLMVLEIEF